MSTTHTEVGIATAGARTADGPRLAAGTPTPRRPTVDGSTASPVSYARAAGVLYLIIFACGIFSEVVVRSRLIVDGDAAATAENILTSEGLFRVGLVSDLLMVLSDVALAVLLYFLLRPVSVTLSLIAAAFRLAQAAVLGINLLNQHMAVQVLGGGRYLDAFDQRQLEAVALLSLDRHMFGYLIGLVFFGVHLAVLGYLVYRSTYLPRTLAVLLVLAAIGYLADSLTYFLVPGYDGAISAIVLAPAVVAELATILWLLIKGVNVPRWQQQAQATSRNVTPETIGA